VVDLSTPAGDGRTALSHGDMEGLIPSHISTRGDLFEAEQRNIAEALLRRSPTLSTLLDDRFLRDLHRHMFGRVWTWAGRYRTLETNMGCSPPALTCGYTTIPTGTSTLSEGGLPHSRKGPRHPPAATARSPSRCPRHPRRHDPRPRYGAPLVALEHDATDTNERGGLPGTPG